MHVRVDVFHSAHDIPRSRSKATAPGIFEDVAHLHHRLHRRLRRPPSASAALRVRARPGGDPVDRRRRQDVAVDDRVERHRARHHLGAWAVGAASIRVAAIDGSGGGGDARAPRDAKSVFDKVGRPRLRCGAGRVGAARISEGPAPGGLGLSAIDAALRCPRRSTRIPTPRRGPEPLALHGNLTSSPSRRRREHVPCRTRPSGGRPACGRSWR